MQRKHALIVSGILTFALTGAALAAGIVDAAPAARQPTPTPLATVAVPVLAPATVPTTTLAAGAASTQNVDPASVAQKAAADLDAQAQPEIARLQQQVDALEASTRTRLQNVATLHQQVTDLQTGIADDANVYNNAVAELQTTEAQLRQQLNDTVAALEAAYAELSARQGAQGSSPAEVQPVNNPSDDGNEDSNEQHEQEHQEHEEHGGGDND